MQSDKIATETLSRQKLSMDDVRLRKIQQLFSYGLILIPLAGAIATISLLGYSVTYIDLAVLIVMYVSSMAGIRVGYHRLVAHKAFQTSNTVIVVLAILGCMSAQGHVIHWVSNHRRHHQFSDRQGDPHSPHISPTSGEAWHNNHHAPNSAIFGLKWWQLDPGAWVVRILEGLGLVWDVKQPTANMMQIKKMAKA